MQLSIKLEALRLTVSQSNVWNSVGIQIHAHRRTGNLRCCVAEKQCPSRLEKQGEGAVGPSAPIELENLE